MTARADDRGVATVWAAGAIAALVSIAVLGLYLGAAMVTRHHAESAADLAALAGAAHAPPGETYACTQARRVTDRMRVRLVSCHLRGWDVLVDVTVQPTGWLGGLGAATGRARAGPAEPEGWQDGVLEGLDGRAVDLESTVRVESTPRRWFAGVPLPGPVNSTSSTSLRGETSIASSWTAPTGKPTREHAVGMGRSRASWELAARPARHSAR